MKIKIVSRFTLNVLFECEAESMKVALKLAIDKGADLRGADLRGADLRSANLYGADLRGADLRSADLRSADLRSADLRSADLYGADLRSANLRSADLYGADLSGADLTDIKNMATFQIVPEIGPFYAFKKLQNGVIATLYVPRSAKRVNSTGRKCRVEKVKVIELTNGVTEAFDKHSGKLLYKVGSWVKPDSFDNDIRNECTNGIHCFITKKEAEDYN